MAVVAARRKFICFWLIGRMFEMSIVSSLLGAILKTAFNNLGAKKTVGIATSKPVREIGKKIIKHEVKKRLK